MVELSHHRGNPIKSHSTPLTLEQTLNRDQMQRMLLPLFPDSKLNYSLTKDVNLEEDGRTDAPDPAHGVKKLDLLGK